MQPTQCSYAILYVVFHSSRAIVWPSKQGTTAMAQTSFYDLFMNYSAQGQAINEMIAAFPAPEHNVTISRVVLTALNPFMGKPRQLTSKQVKAIIKVLS